MSYKSTNPTKLVLKGHKHIKKKSKKRKLQDSEQISPNNIEGWSQATDLQELIGPLFVLHQANQGEFHSFYCDEFSNLKVKPLLTKIFDEVVPSEVEQTIIGYSLPETNRYLFKTCYNKYLSSDKFGFVACNKDACGSSEEWIPTITDNGVVFKSAFGNYLSVDEKTLTFRADSKDLGTNETFLVKCQTINKTEIKSKLIIKKKEMSLPKLEAETTLKTQGWYLGNAKFASNKFDDLKKAKKEGRLNEALLERRSKVKSDRYCK